MDVAVIIAEYKCTLKTIGYAQNTIEQYRWGLEQFADYLEKAGIEDLRCVTRQLVVDYQAGLRQRPLAAETKAVLIRSVKRLFEHLTGKHLLLINPCEGIVEINRKQRPIGTVLTVRQMQRLLQQPNLSLRTGIRDRAMIEVFYATAIRCDELVNLAVHDADLKDNVLYIRKAKGGRQRVAPMGEAAAKYLKEYLEKIRPRHGRKNPKLRTLFLNHHGTGLTGNSIRAFLAGYRKSARIKKPITPHTLRRTCATHLLQGGADIRFVQKLLGHKDIKTTQRYTRILPVEVKQMHSATHPNARKEKP